MTTKLKLLTRDDILAADDRTSEAVEVPEWGGAVRVRALSGRERDHYMTSLYTMAPNDQGAMVISSVNFEGSATRLVALTVVGEDGERLFSEADVLALADKNGAVIDRVYRKASDLSRLGQTVEQVKADLGVAQNGSSGTA